MRPNLEFYKQTKKIHGLELIRECDLIKKAVHKYKFVDKSDEQLLIDIAERLIKTNWIRNVVFKQIALEISEFEMKEKIRNHGGSQSSFPFAKNSHEV